MARQIGFHFYSFKIWPKHSRQYETLSAIKGRQDVLTLLHASMRTLIDSQHNNEAAKRMACIKRVDLDGRHLTGLLEAGGYGETANIVQTHTGVISHRQKTTEASMLPCFFRLTIPQHSDRGVLILQRDNRVPAKQALVEILRQIVQEFDEQLTCDLIPIANKETFEKLVRNGDIQEVRFVRLSIPQDFADGYDRGRAETQGSVEVSYKARRGSTLPMKNTIRGWLRGGADALDQYEIPGLDFDYDTAKVKIRIGKKLQNVDFGKQLTQPIVDVTDRVRFEPRSGHPAYESLVEITAELAEDDTFTAYGE